jgi:hypothetical protein
MGKFAQLGIVTSHCHPIKQMLQQNTHFYAALRTFLLKTCYSHLYTT